MVKRIVEIADMIISSDPNDILITYALGSCLGITVYAAKFKVGALLHVMLPQSSIDPKRSLKNPFMFIDTGLEKVFEEFKKRGVSFKNMTVKVAGGASFKNAGENDLFEIGRRNFNMLQKILLEKGVFLNAYDIGGTITRNISIDINSGDVLVKKEGIENYL